MREQVVVVEASHHHSSMGTSVYFSPSCLPSSMGFECGEGDRFQVTVRRLPRLMRGPRFPRNPFRATKPEKGRRKPR
jgi:hypothetical protein